MVNSMDYVHFLEFVRQNVIFASPEEETKLAAIAAGASLISKKLLFVVNGSFQLNSVDIILQYSRGPKIGGYSNTIDGLSAKNSNEVPDEGTWISVQQTCFKISCQERKLEVQTDLSRMQFVVFRSQALLEASIDQSELQNFLQQSVDCLYEISLSNLASTFSLASSESFPSSGNVTDSLDDFTPADISPSKIATENPNLHPLGPDRSLGFVSNNLQPASNHWLTIYISVSEVFLVRSTVKNVLTGAHQMNKLLLSVSVGEELRTISWAVQVLIFTISIFILLVSAFHLYFVHAVNHVNPLSRGCSLSRCSIVSEY